jgi:hypothetical protein
MLKNEDIKRLIKYHQTQLDHMPVEKLEANSDLAADDFAWIDALKATLIPF